MSVTLAANVNSTIRNITLSDALSGVTNGDLFLLEDEIVEFEHFKTPRNPRLLDQTKIVVRRGVAGTTPASHTSGTAVQAVVLSYVASADESKPDPVGTGGSGVNLDPGDGTPVPITTLVAPGAVIAGDSATLDGPFNGGEITGPLTIDTADDVNTTLIVASPAGSQRGLQVTHDGATALETVVDLTTSQVTTTVNDLAVIDGIVGETWVYQKDAGRTNVAVFNTSDGDVRFAVYDDTQAEIFRINNDGSIHIKTGTSIVADL